MYKRQVLKMDSGSLTCRRLGVSTLEKVRMDCCGRWLSQPSPSGTIRLVATSEAKVVTTTSSHCHGCTGSHR